MPYEVRWHTEKRILLVREYGVMTAEELRRMHEDVNRYVELGQPPVHIISDQRSLESFPQDLSTMRQLSEMRSQPNVGWRVNIVTGATGRLLTTTLTQLSARYLKAAHSVDEALGFIARVDPTLADLV